MIQHECPLCGNGFDDFGQWHTAGDKVLCYSCGRSEDGLTPVPIDADRDIVSDYCREETDDDIEEAAKAEWIADVEAAGGEWSDDSSMSGAEIGWSMTLNQAFWLALSRQWFSPAGFYGPEPVEEILARLLTIRDVSGSEYKFSDMDKRQREDAVRQVKAAWEKYQKSNRFAAIQKGG